MENIPIICKNEIPPATVDGEKARSATKAGGKGEIGGYMKSLTEEERKALARKAGQKSREMYRQRKSFKESMLLLLSGQDGEKLQQDLNLSMIKQALDGNTKAYELIQSTVGENATSKVELGTGDCGLNVNINVVE